MTTIEKYQPSETIQIQTKYGILRYDVPEGLTHEQKTILEAYKAPRIESISDVELETFMLRQINQGLLLLGHTRQLQTPEEQNIMSDAITGIFRERFSFLTLSDIALIFKKGIQGDFKNSPDDVVMINVEKVHHWIKCYHQKIRAEVISSLKPVETKKEKPADYNPETDFEALLQKVRSGENVSGPEWICQTAQHYDRLNKAGSFSITPEQRKAIFQEEREKLIRDGKNKMLHISTETRFMFRAFMESQPGENQYQKEVATICRIRVFREYVEELAKQQKAA